jgi:CDP-diglyceride synthetase
MHCIATSVSFWIYTIVNETIDYMVKKQSGKHKNISPRATG